MTERRRGLESVFLDFVLIAGAVATGAYFLRQMLSTVLTDPEKEKQEQARLRAAAHFERLQRGKRNGQRGSGDGSDESTARRRLDDLQLNNYENVIALDLVAPEDIPVGFDDIGGLDHIIDELKESVIYPLTMPQLFSNAGSLLSAPSGVLLYGPPGCGKTMLAKALAHESGASFINLHISTLLEKWYGDSNKLVRAVFSLARKMQPTIIFIDEIDAVLRTRASSDHEASGMVKAEFMALWDGLATATESGQPPRIVVLGATNRMHDIDEAILRRMPKRFAISLPAADQRRRILQLILHDTKVDKAEFDLEYIVKVTEGMSGSDIKEACRDAAMIPFREFMKDRRGNMSNANIDTNMIRGVRTEDFFGRRGGSQTLMNNHFIETAKMAAVDDLDDRSRGSARDEEFQDVEE